MKAIKLIKKALRWFKKKPSNDPLHMLREDTFSNEETNEMTGRMIRQQYKSEQQ